MKQLRLLARCFLLDVSMIISSKRLRGIDRGRWRVESSTPDSNKGSLAWTGDHVRVNK